MSARSHGCECVGVHARAPALRLEQRDQLECLTIPAAQWQRMLRPNGSACCGPMAAHVAAQWQRMMRPNGSACCDPTAATYLSTLSALVTYSRSSSSRRANLRISPERASERDGAAARACVRAPARDSPQSDRRSLTRSDAAADGGRAGGRVGGRAGADRGAALTSGPRGSAALRARSSAAARLPTSLRE